MIRYFITKVHKRKTLVRPRVVIGVRRESPRWRSGRCASPEQAGAREIFLIEEALAAAIGANIPIHEPAGHHGGGCRRRHHGDSGHIAWRHGHSRLAQDRRRRVRHAIIKYMRTQYNLVIGERMAEEVKFRIGMPSQRKDRDHGAQGAGRHIRPSPDPGDRFNRSAEGFERAGRSGSRRPSSTRWKKPLPSLPLTSLSGGSS